ncbi:unnamed protein product [Phytomonas sp. Hart1]|nr:unnamed protein product [Phytomonas sp. Hart1]|eukprot:CCW68480.1 unnamed protein product [Phytomonas sp. isolate Hart1]
MRRVTSFTIGLKGACFISGVAPVLYFPPSAATIINKEEQIKKNTNIALEMIRSQKGPLPPPYARKTTATIEAIEGEINAILGDSEKMRRSATNDQPMDKLSLMERCLRHALWSYYKEEAKYNFKEMSKWLVYTHEDETQMAQLKRQVEEKEKLIAFREKNGSKNLPDSSLFRLDWNKEYESMIDRELINEKRLRYDTLALNTTERDEAQISKLLQRYRKPAQDKRLDDLVELLERFKSVFAREAIMQRLTIKHLEGQLGVWRYMDWCPEVRDRAELELDITGWQWWSPFEERRVMPIRLRSLNEVRKIMGKKQTQKAAELAELSPKGSKSSDGDRERLLKEILSIQASIYRRDEEPVGEKKSAH